MSEAQEACKFVFAIPSNREAILPASCTCLMLMIWSSRARNRSADPCCLLLLRPLARWFLGDFLTVQGIADTFYWNMPVDDNCFMLLRTAERKTAFLHVSCTEWKNTFSLEIYGRQGKLDISGLGGSYGPERVALYRMLPGMGPPETTIYEYPMEDDSWAVELSELIEDIRLDREPAPGLADALAVLRIVEQIYEAS